MAVKVRDVVDSNYRNWSLNLIFKVGCMKSVGMCLFTSEFWMRSEDDDDEQLREEVLWLKWNIELWVSFNTTRKESRMGPWVDPWGATQLRNATLLLNRRKHVRVIPATDVSVAAHQPRQDVKCFKIKALSCSMSLSQDTPGETQITGSPLKSILRPFSVSLYTGALERGNFVSLYTECYTWRQCSSICTYWKCNCFLNSRD